MSDSKRETVDHRSFVDGVKNPLGILADACLDAYEENRNPLLEEAANALRAIEMIDLSGCVKIAYPRPLPWHIVEDVWDQDNTPILASNHKAILIRDGGYYPPELPVSNSIVECMNTVHALQTKNGD